MLFQQIKLRNDPFLIEKMSFSLFFFYQTIVVKSIVKLKKHSSALKNIEYG